MKNKYHSLLRPLAAAAILLPAASASAQVVSYCDPAAFDTATDIVYNGVAKKDAAKGMWLTQKGGAFKAGTAFYKDPLTFKAGVVNRSFWTYFRFRIGPDAAPNGGNGLTFIMNGSPSGALALGANDDGMGFGGIGQSIVFEFDTHQDEKPADHLSLMLNGDQFIHKATAKTSGLVPDVSKFVGTPMDVWIDYDHTIPAFKVYMSPASDPPQRKTAELVWEEAPGGVLPQNLDLGGVLLTGHVGFTSATGSQTNDHEILKWEFSTEGVPCDCAGATAAERDAYCAVVAPGTPSCNPVDPNVPDGPKVCGCTADAQCPDYMNAKCDVAPGTQQCVPCTEDANCAHFNDPKKALCVVGICGECKANADCPMDRPVCDLDQPVPTCIDGCKKDSDCPTRDLPRCNTALPKPACDKCTSDDNCTRFGAPEVPPTPICGAAESTNAGICVECNVDAECNDPAKPVCLAASNTCVECETNDDCKDPLEPICNTSAHQCECPAGQTCPITPGRFIAGGGCSLSQESAKDALSALGAVIAAAAAALARRRRRG